MVLQPNTNERQQYECSEGFGQLVVACRDATAFLDSSDKPLHHVAPVVDEALLDTGVKGFDRGTKAALRLIGRRVRLHTIALLILLFP